MYIEKIQHTSQTQALPGLTDILLGCDPTLYHYFPVKHIASVLGSYIIQELAQHNIFIGTRYGTKGVTIESVVNGDVDITDTVFEIDQFTYAMLTPLMQRALHKIPHIVHDLTEGGDFLKNRNKHSITMSGSIHSEHDINMVLYWLCTLSASIATSNITPQCPAQVEQTLAIVPIHKARNNRVQMLHSLDQRGVLDYCDWSLWLNFDADNVLGDFERSPNVSVNRWTYASTHPFVQKYQRLLPKKLDSIELIDDCVPLPKQYHGKHRWHVVCETFDHRYFVTEKTFKAFIGGAVPLTVAKAGFNSHLEKIGFVLPGNYDHLHGQERIDAIADMIESDCNDYTEIVQHNWHLATDKKRVAQIFVQPLVKWASEYVCIQ